jgi:hypothetical protein
MTALGDLAAPASFKGFVDRNRDPSARLTEGGHDEVE